MKKYLLLIVFLVFLSACKDKKVATEPKKETFSLAKTEYTILPFSENDHYIFKDVKTTQLSDKELIEIEVLFQKMVTERNAAEAKRLVKHNKENPYNQWEETGFELETKGFRRQYLPVINEKGEKEVWINFFCNYFENMYWQESRILVLDGGNCYYNLKVNLSTKKIYELYINGYG